MDIHLWSRLEQGECLQASCLQGGEEEFEHGGESFSLNNLLREAENGWLDAVNPVPELKSARAKYTVIISMFWSVQYMIILIMLIDMFLKYGVSEFSPVLLSGIFLDLYGVVGRKRIQRIC